MLRGRLKNIANKSKELNKPKVVGDPFDEFKKSLPNLIDDSYRLKAAWEAYGKPKNYKEALWYGLIQPIDEANYKLPSIGYNEETDEYEYLNKGKENETVAKDIRVWDNDVIPLVKELKLGGYVRTFNEEKDCWTYTKNSQKENTLDLKGSSVGLEPNLQDIEYLKNGGQTKKERKYKTYNDFYNYLKSTERLSSDYAMEDFYNDENAYFDWEKRELETPGEAHFTDRYKLPYHYTFSKESKYATLPFENGGGGEWILNYNGEWIFKTSPFLENQHTLDLYIRYFGEKEPYSSLIYNGKTYSPEEIKTLYLLRNGYPAAPFDKWSKKPKAFKQGGQMSVIPEGALHARKNNMEGAGEDFTSKGIPVVDNKGELQAEIECNEIIFRKQITDKMEELYKKYNAEESTSKKDEIAIEMGKILTCEITKHTDDRTGLIEQILEKI